MRTGFNRYAMLCLLALLLSAGTASARPIPTGMGTITASYMTNQGPVSFNGTRDYAGIGPGSATPLGAAPNISAFNSVNTVGFRQLVDNAFPLENVVNDHTESLVTNAFYKINNNGEFFPGLVPDGDVTIHIENMTFSEAVTIIPSTFLLHTRWLPSQVDAFPPVDAYVNLHNHHTATPNFRDLDLFEASGVFAHGHGGNDANAGFGDVSPLILGDGTAANPLSIELTVPYHLLANFEQHDQAVPPGLPGPQGFLEPYHLHLEYVVVPEPVTVVLLAISSLGAVLHRHRRRVR